MGLGWPRACVRIEVLNDYGEPLWVRFNVARSRIFSGLQSRPVLASTRKYLFVRLLGVFANFALLSLPGTLVTFSGVSFV